MMEATEIGWGRTLDAHQTHEGAKNVEMAGIDSRMLKCKWRRAEDAKSLRIKRRDIWKRLLDILYGAPDVIGQIRSLTSNLTD